MPKVTIITPCYNAERHLAETLASVQAQTMGDYEHLCVDDGSTDATPELLAAYAASDERVRVIKTSNAGAGAARNLALEQARGTWVYCVDGDDLMAPTLLEEAVACGEKTDADVVVFRLELLDDETGEVQPFAWCFDTSWLGEGVCTFNPQAHVSRILNSFQNWVHNKLFRRAFLDERGIRFQDLHRTEELMFTGRALTEARRISLLDRTLHQYRTNNAQSSIVNSDPYCLEFYEAFVTLRRHLEQQGTWELYRTSFVNWAMEGVGGNLLRARSPEAFWTIAHTMRDGGLDQLGICGIPRADAYNARQWDVCEALRTCPDELLPIRLLQSLVRETELMGGIIAQHEEALSEGLAEIDKLWHYNEDMRDSLSFRVGRAMTAPLRKARNLRNGLRGC